MNKIQLTGLTLAASLLAGLVAVGAANEKKDHSTKIAESSVTTNDNGSVSRVFVESTISTNGNLVTEHRRETRTTMDNDGNVLGTTTSEYAQSYNVGDTGWKLNTQLTPDNVKPVNTDTFMGLKFGDVLGETNTVREAGEPSLLRIAFKPKKPLAGFDDYYAYVTPKTHKIAKICACAKKAVEPGGNWQRHYLIEAREKRYNTWARPCSWSRPYYAFRVAPERCVTVCLAGASETYQTVINAWDENLVRLADEEEEALRREARTAARSRRDQQVKDAANAF